MKNIWIKSCQLAAYVALALPLRVLFKIERIGDLDLEQEKRYILCSNHSTCLDPFLILSSFPRKEFMQLLPVRFITSHRYLGNPLSRALLLSMGCVSTAGHRGKKVLCACKESLTRGETVFIFPTGRVDKPGLKEPPKVGVVYLEREADKALILPIRIDIAGECDRSAPRLFSGVKIRIGKTFRHTTYPKDLQPLADEVMERIG